MSKITTLTKKADKILKQNFVGHNVMSEIETNCLDQLSVINKNIETCIEMFNGIVTNISNTLKLECPKDYMITVYAFYIGNIIKKEPSEPISKFILTIYSNDVYREYIAQENEKFFMTNTDIVDDEDVSKLLHFRTCWKHLSSSGKAYIKNALRTMIDISGEYLVQKDNGNTILSIMQNLKLKTQHVT